MVFMPGLDMAKSAIAWPTSSVVGVGWKMVRTTGVAIVVAAAPPTTQGMPD